MKLRKSILPRTIADWGATTFLIILIPVTFWFEIFVVISSFYEYWSFWFNLHFTCGVILLVNITTSLMGVMLCDTSIKGVMLPTTLTDDGTTFCSVCECIIPPRAWHCSACKICILKRDHHCMFTSCCIGQNNHRYFMMLLGYLCLSTLYASYMNAFFMWERFELKSLWSLINVVFPLASLVLDNNPQQYNLIIVIINFLGFLFTTTLCVYHSKLILNGTINYEKEKKIDKYDLGRRGNIIGVFGKNWRFAWLSPLIKSPLPQDGTQWKAQDTIKFK